MKIKIQKALIALAAVAVLAGCRDDIFGTQNPRTEYYSIHNWSQLFDSYWRGMNNNYVFWDFDPTDWDAVYDEYKPKFDALAASGFADSTVNDSAVSMFRRITADIVDGHYTCTFNIPVSGGGNFPVSFKSWRLTPSFDRVSERDGYHEGFTSVLEQLDVLEKMNSEGRFDGFRLNYVEDYTNFYSCGILDDGILYLRFYTFTLSSHVGTGDAADSLFNYYCDCLDNLPDLKGVIIDVRGNGGGETNDLSLILGKFVDKEHIVFYTRQKNGPGRLDYTPWVPEVLVPRERKRELDVPLVVLADMCSVSMSEMTALSVLTLPNGCVIGERTFGGLGQLDPSNKGFDEYYGGYFMIPGPYSDTAPLLEVYTTMTMTKAVDGTIYEGVGVPPTIEEPYDRQSIAAGVDNQLERAVRYIKTGE